jgi:betaine-aldehyde dehydrogenase
VQSAPNVSWQCDFEPLTDEDERAQLVARKIRAGQVRVHAGRPPAGAPFGSYKQSGLGREHGVHGLEELLELKALFV